MQDKISSIKNRLKNISQKMARDYNFVLQLYFQERFIYRLSISEYKNNFILKGGLFIFIFSKNSFRPTKDIDFLGYKVSNDIKEIETIFKSIAEIPVDDGIIFKTDSIKTEIIKEGADYEGIRFKISGFLGNIKQPIIIDIGFGDKITPMAKEFTYPILLENQEPVLFSYNYETVIAEKIEAICKLGVATSRMKDFYDINFIFEKYDLDSETIKNAINNTFINRGTDKSLFNNLKNDSLWNNQEKMWSAFQNKIRNKNKTSFKKARNLIINNLINFFS